MRRWRQPRQRPRLCPAYVRRLCLAFWRISSPNQARRRWLLRGGCMEIGGGVLCVTVCVNTASLSLSFTHKKIKAQNAVLHMLFISYHRRKRRWDSCCCMSAACVSAAFTGCGRSVTTRASACEERLHASSALSK